jgi:hypothetical protein
MVSTDSPRVSTPKITIDTAMMIATIVIYTNTPLAPTFAATDVTRNGKKMLLTRPIALQKPEPDSFAEVGHISGTYTADA